MIDEIKLPQPEGGHVSLNGGTTAGVVYVVVHYSKEPDILNNIDIMGTYSTVEAADTRIMRSFPTIPNKTQEERKFPESVDITVNEPTAKEATMKTKISVCAAPSGD